jgi:polyvinyl alcohol dehydrogenase (cytochrome)
MARFLKYHLIIGFAIIVSLAAALSLRSQSNELAWAVAGQNVHNTRSQPNEHAIGRANVASLATKWTFTTGADVSATPTVAGDAVYFPDWSGNFYAVRRDTGAQIWLHKISDYDGYAGSIARVSPAVHGNDLIIGDIESGTVAHNGANVMAVNRQTGALRWITKVDAHPAAVITGSPVVQGDIVYVGVSSTEESLATDPTYACCSFRGSLVALDINTGAIVWQTFTMPDNQGQPDGYSGGAIWQPPAIDVKRGMLYVGTGNNYEVPQSVKTCLAETVGGAQTTCFDAGDMYDTALALDMTTGAVKWSKRVQGVDVWTVACIKNPNPVSCPEPNSPDYDLSGSGPNLLPNLVGFGQKSGIYWAFNPDTGDILWTAMVGPGSSLGGIEWGTATDGERIYIAITNSKNLSYPLINGSTITWGAWSALDVSTGRILWQTADPAQAVDVGSVSVANQVVYVGSVSGNMHALDAGTGKILWTFASGGSVIDGPAIAGGTVFWGSGYKKITSGTGNNKVFAFSIKQGG